MQLKIDKNLYDQILEYFLTDDKPTRQELEPAIKAGLADKELCRAIHSLNRIAYSPRAQRGEDG